MKYFKPKNYSKFCNTNSAWLVVTDSDISAALWDKSFGGVFTLLWL